MTEMNIVTAFNRQYLLYAYVLFQSILVNNEEEPIHFYVLESELRDTDKDIIREVADKYGKKISFIRLILINSKERFRQRSPGQEKHSTDWQ